MARLLPGGWLASYLEYTQAQESPTNFHLWTGLSVLSSTVRRHIWIDRGFYTLYPNLYVILVAMSARCRKSVSLGIGIRFLRKVKDVRIFHAKTSTEGMIDYFGTVPPHQVGTKILIDCSALVYSSELAVFLSKANYSSDILTVLTDLFEGQDEWTYKTKTKGEILLTNIAPSLLAATTPESLAKCMPLDVFGLGFEGRER